MKITVKGADLHNSYMYIYIYIYIYRAPDKKIE